MNRTLRQNAGALGPRQVAIRPPFVPMAHVVARHHATTLVLPGARFQRQGTFGTFGADRDFAGALGAGRGRVDGARAVVQVQYAK
jgi:hypothetical protein